VLARNGRKVLNFVYFLFALGVGVWGAGIGVFLSADDASVAAIAVKSYYIAPLLITSSLLVFGYLFPNRTKVPPPLRLVACIAPLPFIILILLGSSFLVTDITISAANTVVLDIPTYTLYAIYIIAAFMVVIYLLAKAVKRSKGIGHQQAKLFLVGILFSAVAGLYFNLILPWLSNYALIWIGPLMTTAFLIASGISIVRHRMFDITPLVARSLAYTLALVVSVVAYGLVFYGVIWILFGKQLEEVLYVIVALSGVVGGLLLQAFKRYFDAFTDRVFFRKSYKEREVIDSLNQLLITNVQLDDLLRSTARLLERTFQAEYCAVGVIDVANDGYIVHSSDGRSFSKMAIDRLRKLTVRTRKLSIVTDDLDESRNIALATILSENKVALLARLTENHRKVSEGVGYIALGPRKSGNGYSSQDVALMDTIAKELVVGIQSALRLKQIEQFNETLKQRIDSATRELRESNEKLKAIDSSKDDFISMASHQLRTPLTSVKGYLSMVLEGDAGKVPESQRKMLEQAFTSSQRMTYLISDLLNLSRLKTGKFVILPSQVNLAHVVEQEVNQLRRMAEANTIELVVNLPDSLPELELDETKMRQVIMNLIDNAIYYTPAKGTITVELRETVSSVEFTVTDTGIGVPKAEQHKLFSRFYRASNAKKSRPDGTGLGLFMAKKAVAAQGGAIIFRSTEGQGSTFGFSFPKKRH